MTRRAWAGRLFTAGLALTLAALQIAALRVYSLEVKGLSCPFCAYGLEKKLKRLEGVTAVSIDLSGSEVQLRSGRELSREEVEKVVRKAGFRLGEFREEALTDPVAKPPSGDP